MTARSPAGQPWLQRARSPFLAVLLVVSLGLPLGLASGGTGATAAIDEAAPNGQEHVPLEPEVPHDEPQPSETPPPIEAAPVQPTMTPEPAPADPEPTTAPPVDVLTPTPGPEPMEVATAHPEKREETDAAMTPAANVDGSDALSTDLSARDVSVTTTSTVGCYFAAGASQTIPQAEVGYFDCVLDIVLGSVPEAFTSIELDWTLNADVSTGWTVDLAARDGVEQADGESRTSGIGPSLRGVDRLSSGDDDSVDPTEQVRRHSVHFGLQLTAPRCGGPIEPVVSVDSVVVSKIDDAVGTESHNRSALSVGPVLGIAVPIASVDRSTVGAPVDPNDPLRFSHADQVVGAGTLEIAVTGGVCGGWSVSISATDFATPMEGAVIPVGNLVVTNIAEREGAPAPVARVLQLANEPQSIISAPNESLVGGTYSYVLDLELTVPGGTPPGVYSSTVTVTTSAAP